MPSTLKTVLSVAIPSIAAIAIYIVYVINYQAPLSLPVQHFYTKWEAVTTKFDERDPQDVKQLRVLAEEIGIVHGEGQNMRERLGCLNAGASYECNLLLLMDMDLNLQKSNLSFGFWTYEMKQMLQARAEAGKAVESSEM